MRKNNVNADVKAADTIVVNGMTAALRYAVFWQSGTA